MIETQPPRDIINPGGFYYKDGYVYILELGKDEYLYEYAEDGSFSYNLRLNETGIHIIDDTNPANPINVAFINIPGVNGMAAKGSQLYADSFADLLVFDITNPQNPNLSKRVSDVYQNLGYYGIHVDAELGVNVGYTATQNNYTQKICDDDIQPHYYEGWGYMVGDISLSNGAGTGTPGVGTAGSMARFVTTGNYLYNIDYSDLHLFDISGEFPEKVDDIHIGWEIETIYPHEDKLYFGASDGMYIYDNVNPASPTFLSKYEHIRSCDPVVVNGNYAYVTLRSGSACQGFTNQLDVVDIFDPINPKLERTHQMSNPHGLSIKNNCLFICEGEFGFKSFAIDPLNPTEITQTGYDQSFHSYDVITLPHLMMIIGKDGFYQFSLSCGSNLEYLGVIPFGQNS
jgi:hypothetical protein